MSFVSMTLQSLFSVRSSAQDIDMRMCNDDLKFSRNSHYTGIITFINTY